MYVLSPEFLGGGARVSKPFATTNDESGSQVCLGGCLSMKRNARQPREQEERSAGGGCGTEDDKHPKAQGRGEIRKQKDPEPATDH